MIGWLKKFTSKEEPPRKEDELKLIGSVRFDGEYGTEKNVRCYVTFLMSESGLRKVDIVAPTDEIKRALRRSRTFMDAILWEQGGPFPKHFDPIGDTLREMLARLVADDLTGENEAYK